MSSDTRRWITGPSRSGKVCMATISILIMSTIFALLSIAAQLAIDSTTLGDNFLGDLAYLVGAILGSFLLCAFTIAIYAAARTVLTKILITSTIIALPITSTVIALLIIATLYSFDLAIADNFINILGYIFGSFIWFAFTVGIYNIVRAHLTKILSVQ